MTKETCSSTLENDQLNGWRECSHSINCTSIEFFVDGNRDLQTERRERQLRFEIECEELGFTPKTPEFGNCVLKLRELAQGSKRRTIIQSQPAQTAPSTVDKIEGTKQILEAIQGVTTPAQTTGKQIDLGCVNVCQAQGKSLMYCRSDCAY